jgi:hypothetical protein
MSYIFIKWRVGSSASSLALGRPRSASEFDDGIDAVCRPPDITLSLSFQVGNTQYGHGQLKLDNTALIEAASWLCVMRKNGMDLINSACLWSADGDS